MMRKNFACMVFCVIFAFLLVGMADAADPIKLKFAHIMPAQSPVDKTFKLWSQKIFNESEGTLEIEVFGGGVLGRNPLLYLQQIDDGVFDIAQTYPTYFGERFDDINVFFLPFLSETMEETSLVAQRMADRGLLRGLEGYKVLNLIASGPYYLHSTFPVKAPNDLKGHKCRSGGKVQAEWITRLGMTPIGLPANKLAESLSRGLIDVCPVDGLSMKMLRVADSAKYTVQIPLGNFIMLVAMNKKKYENLPPKAKSALDNNIGEPYLKEFQFVYVGTAERNTYEEYKNDPTHTIIVPKGEDLNRWKEALWPVAEKWKSENPHREKLFNAVEQELRKIRAGS